MKRKPNRIIENSWWKYLFGLVCWTLSAAPSLNASVMQCTYDAAGRLVGVQYDTSSQLTHQYDHSGSLRRASVVAATGPDLTIAFAFFPSQPQSGAAFQIHSTIANLGGSLASQVRFQSTLPVGFEILSAMSSQAACSIAGGTITCDLGTLNPGEDASVQVTLRANVFGEFAFRPIVSTLGDANPENDSFSGLLTVLEAPALLMQVGPPGTGITILWPARAEGWQLQETINLSPPVIWTATTTPLLIDDSFQVRIQVDKNHRFYRLIQE